MPTYEYQCQSCKNRFETRQRMTDEPLTVCPECGGHIRRVFFPAGIVFKGSGFYKTDNAPKAGASENGHSAKSEGTKAGSETKTSGETQPAASTSDSSSSKASESKEPAGTK
jgi:putative FmdB family regulatory protein